MARLLLNEKCGLHSKRNSDKEAIRKFCRTSTALKPKTVVNNLTKEWCSEPGSHTARLAVFVEVTLSLLAGDWANEKAASLSACGI